MITTRKQNIDWDKCREYVAKVFPSLKSGVNGAFSSLKKSKPYLMVDGFPPRIELWFVPKSGELKYQSENEIEREQRDISAKVTELADRNKLRVWGGAGDIEGKWRHNLGVYTFKPKYSDFKK